MTETLNAIAAAFETGANGAIMVLAYAVFKHELRITSLEGRK